MTLVNLPSPILWPGLSGTGAAAPVVVANTTLDAAGEYLAFVFCARENMTISHIGFRALTVAGSPTAEVRIETVDQATGMPSGTLWNLNGTGAAPNGVTGTISTNTNVLQALTNPAIILKGDVVCVKVAYASGTSIQVAGINNYASPYASALPYQVANTGTPTRTGLSVGSMTFAIGSSATAFYQVSGTIPVSGTAGGTFNNTSSAKRGMSFTLPFRCRIIGIRWYNSNSNGDHTISLQDNAGSDVGSTAKTYDGDVNANATNSSITEYFANPFVGAKNSTYRAVLEPTSANNINLPAFTLPSADYRGATPSGTSAQYSTYTSGGGWVDTNTSIPAMDLIIDQIDDGDGSGGGGTTIVSGVIG